MLDQLPTEIIEHILGYLPTASSIVKLDCVNRRLHKIISADDYAVFRNFVQHAFPSISTSTAWRETACILTSRSRAWHRRAFMARECLPPMEQSYIAPRDSRRSNFGYIPAIDSYEDWQGSNSDGRKEVVAVGAAGRLRVRITQKGKIRWYSYQTLDDHLPPNDILDVKLLRPRQNRNEDCEAILLRRFNNEMSLIHLDRKTGQFQDIRSYSANLGDVDCLDVSGESEPVLAVCNIHAIQLFPLYSSREETRAQESLPVSQHLTLRHRKRCAKFLDNKTLAISVQYVEGRQRAPIEVFDVSPTGLSNSPLQASQTTPAWGVSDVGRHSANIVVPLDVTASLSSRPGQVFLSGWTDGVARLHDLRTPSEAVCEYTDTVDVGQILSILPIGHERFLAGSDLNGCLKTYDLRIPGANVYSHLEALAPVAQTLNNIKSSLQHQRPATTSTDTPKTRRDINIFLALTIPRQTNLWQPLPRRQDPHLPRYRGSVYSLSSPSPSSPTVYAGIENHVIQLDFVGTDDLHSNPGGRYDRFWTDEKEPILDLSCYEKPRVGRESTDPVLLRKQTGWDRWKQGEAEVGWDQRWRLNVLQRRGW